MKSTIILRKQRHTQIPLLDCNECTLLFPDISVTVQRDQFITSYNELKKQNDTLTKKYNELMKQCQGKRLIMFFESELFEMLTCLFDLIAYR